MTMVLHYNIKVFGRVQGVWFRDSTRRKAREFGITGFVRNEPDGSVYIEAEGYKDNLESLVEWCWIGPERAEVQDVIVENGSVLSFEGFEITRF